MKSLATSCWSVVVSGTVALAMTFAGAARADENSSVVDPSMAAGSVGTAPTGEMGIANRDPAEGENRGGSETDRRWWRCYHYSYYPYFTYTYYRPVYYYYYYPVTTWTPAVVIYGDGVKAGTDQISDRTSDRATDRVTDGLGR